MTELDALAGIMSSGADAAVMGICYFLWKMERRIHNLELKTGIKKLFEEAS